MTKAKKFVQWMILGRLYTYVKYPNGHEYVGWCKPGDDATPMWPLFNIEELDDVSKGNQH